jgi:hypothetical protein
VKLSREMKPSRKLSIYEREIKSEDWITEAIKKEE